MAKIVQVPPTEIAKVKQQLESERIQLAKQRREIQSAQNKSAAIKQGIGLVVAAATGALGLYKLQEKKKMQEAQLREQELDRQSRNVFKALTLGAAGAGVASRVAPAVFEAAAPESLKEWWEEKQLSAATRKARTTQSSQTEAQAQGIKESVSDIYDVVSQIYTTQTNPGVGAHFPDQIKALADLDTGDPNNPIGPWLERYTKPYSKTGGFQTSNEPYYPGQTPHYYFGEMAPHPLRFPLPIKHSSDKYNITVDPNGYYVATPKGVDPTKLAKTAAYAQNTASYLLGTKLAEKLVMKSLGL